MGHLGFIGRARGQDVNAVVLVHQEGDEIRYSVAGRPELGFEAHPVASLYSRATLASIHGLQPTPPGMLARGAQVGLGVLLVLAVALYLILRRK